MLAFRRFILLSFIIILYIWFLPSTYATTAVMMALEEPITGSVYSGVSNVRGWAVAPKGIQKVELYIDSKLQGNIPSGGKRSDVGLQYPNYPDSINSGFAMAFNYSELAAGAHNLAVRAFANNGEILETTAYFTVVRFTKSYIADSAAVSLAKADVARDGNTIKIQNLVADGKNYNIKLNWHAAAQGFAVTTIEAIGAPSSPTYTGTWEGISRSSVYVGVSSSWTTNIVQEGDALTGSITIVDLGMVNAKLTGKVSGNSVSFGDIAKRISFIGTVNADFNTFNGHYAIHEINDNGTVQGTKIY